MKNFKSRVEQISPDIYRQFKVTLETGRWPDGRQLDQSQRDIVMETIIIYEHAHIPENQRVGSISDRCASFENPNDGVQALTIK